MLSFNFAHIFGRFEKIIIILGYRNFPIIYMELIMFTVEPLFCTEMGALFLDYCSQKKIEAIS